MTKKTKSAKRQKDQAGKTPSHMNRVSQMLGFARQPKKGQELLQALSGLELELETAYQTVRNLPTGDPGEDDALEAVRDMENRRFALLSEIHGNKVQAYKWVSA